MKSSLNKYYVVAVILFIVCLALIVAYPFFLGFGISSDSKEWSNFGAYVSGVVGPVLSLLAFVGVLITIANQNEENHKASEETQKHATENRIIKQIEFHHNICNNVKIPANIDKTKFKEGRIAFEFLYEKNLKTFYDEVEKQSPHLDEEQKIDSAFSKLYNKEGKQFGFYFRNLYYLIHYIDESQKIDKNHYAKLVRAQLSTPEIQMLMYNCLFKKGKNFKKLVTDYGLLNGIEKTEMIKQEHEDLFDSKAFE